MTASSKPRTLLTPWRKPQQPLLAPQLWPGPSRPGRSIQEPLQLGVWENGASEELPLTVPVQVTGIAGTGKTVLGWSLLAESITRRDAAVFGVDVVKGLQTLSPLQPALHASADTPAKARSLAAWFRQQHRDRVEGLAASGLTSWQPGCRDRDGQLMHKLIIWCEEFPAFFDTLTDDEQNLWARGLRSAHRAGIMWVLSLQQPDFTQMPTLARDQLTKMCFGVNEASDACSGLSAYQQDHGCRPELWGCRHPGMHFADIPGLEDRYRVMPARSYSWGGGTAMIAAHAAAWPAADRPLSPRVADSLAECLTLPHG